MEKSFIHEVQLSEAVVDNLKLSNLDLSVLRDSISQNFGSSQYKEEMNTLYKRYKSAVSGNSLARELLQKFMSVSDDNHRLLDDNHNLNQHIVELNKTIYNLTLENDEKDSKLTLLAEFQIHNREMED